MGRLIDADALKRQIAGMTIANNYPPNKANAWCELIDAQPIAYDPDKVVEQLEEAKDIAHDDSVAEMVSTRIWNKAMQTAIGIAKGGGVDA